MLCVGICWYVWMRAGTISPDEFAELCYDMGKTFDDAEVSSNRAEPFHIEQRFAIMLTNTASVVIIEHLCCHAAASVPSAPCRRHRSNHCVCMTHVWFRVRRSVSWSSRCSTRTVMVRSAFGSSSGGGSHTRTSSSVRKSAPLCGLSFSLSVVFVAFVVLFLVYSASAEREREREREREAGNAD